MESILSLGLRMLYLILFRIYVTENDKQKLLHPHNIKQLQFPFPRSRINKLKS